MIGQKSVRVGAFVNAGKPLLAVIPLDALYITANFRETQLARVRAGQSVDIKVDALPGAVLKGTVESLGPASGVSYSAVARSEEHTSELQSLMSNSYAVFCLKK